MLLELIEKSSPHCIVRLLYWCERFNDYSDEQMLKFFKTCTEHGQKKLK